jgi:hypothetical protein
MAKIEGTPSTEEETWKASLDDLKKQMELYEVALKNGDDRKTEEEARKTVASIRNVGDSHTDPRVKKEWHEKAEKFSKASPSKRVTLFDDVGKGLIILLATPFMLAGSAVFAAGSILYGAGLVVRGLGNVLTEGFFSGRNSKENDKDSYDLNRLAQNISVSSLVC